MTVPLHCSLTNYVFVMRVEDARYGRVLASRGSLNSNHILVEFGMLTLSYS